jgi:hypothetical protein
MGITHFVLLCATVTLGAAWLHRVYCPPTSGRIITAFTLGPALAFGGALLAIHSCANGQPIQQWVIPGLVMSAVLCFAESNRSTAVALLVLFSMSTGLSLHYAQIVHGEVWIGVERSVDEENHLVEGHREWHTRLTGLYRRNAEAPKPAKPMPK